MEKDIHDRRDDNARADLPDAVGPATNMALFTHASHATWFTDMNNFPCKLPEAKPSFGAMSAPLMPYVLTLIAPRTETSLTSTLISRARNAVDGGSPVVLSPNEAVDIPCPRQPDQERLAAALNGAKVDAIVVPAANRRKRLLVADMDGTIITGETTDELAAHAGLKQQVAEITMRGMNGEIDFRSGLRERVAMLKGLPISALEATWRSTTLTEGARELVSTMRANGAMTVLVSGGFSYFTSRLGALLGFDETHANILELDNDRIAGRVAEPILDRCSKRSTLLRATKSKGLNPEQTLAVGAV